MAQVVQWARDQAALLTREADAKSADTRWAEDTLASLHTISKIETLEAQFVSVVDISNWDGYSRAMVANVTRNGADHCKQELASHLSLVPFIDRHAEKVFDISLNYEWGGSQYISCVKFACKISQTGKIIVAYSMFGKKWIEKEDYALNKDFWEVSPNPQRIKNFLEAGANQRLVQAIEAPDGQSAIQCAV